MAFKMRGFPYPGKSPVQQAKRPEGPTTNSRIKADQEEDTKQIRAVDPVTGGNNAEYEKEAGKLHADFKTGKISANELREAKKALIARLRKELKKPPTQQTVVTESEYGKRHDRLRKKGHKLQDKAMDVYDAGNEKKADRLQKRADRKFKKAGKIRSKKSATPQKKTEYYYKIGDKTVTKAEYNKYKNPVGDGPTKTTNDPDPSGRKAKIEADRAKNARPTVLTKSQTKAIEKKPPLQAHCVKKK